MKVKLKRVFKSSIAALLILSSFTSSLVYADVTPGSNGTGGAGIIHTEGTGLCEPGVLLYIDTVDNKTSGKDDIKEEIAEREKKYAAGDKSVSIWYDEVGYSVVKEHLINCPEEIADPSSHDMNERGVLIVRDTGTDGKYEGRKIKTEIKHRFLVPSSNMEDTKEIENIYVVPRTTTCSKSTFSLSLVSSKIKADNYVDDFYQNYPKKVTMDYIKSYVSSHKTEMDAAVDEFLYHFQDTGTLAAHLKTLLKDNPDLKDDIAKENLLQYLDLLVLATK